MSEKKETMKKEATEGTQTEEDVKRKINEGTKEIEQQKANAREKCREEIKGILDKYDCELTGRVMVTESGNIPEVFIRNITREGRR